MDALRKKDEYYWLRHSEWGLLVGQLIGDIDGDHWFFITGNEVKQSGSDFAVMCKIEHPPVTATQGHAAGTMIRESIPIFDHPRLSESMSCDVDVDGSWIRTYCELVFDIEFLSIDKIDDFLRIQEFLAHISGGRCMVAITSRCFDPSKTSIIKPEKDKDAGTTIVTQ